MTGPCWYHDADHRPRFAVCPLECSGEVVAGEHAANGVHRLYCDVHLVWRHQNAPHALTYRL